MAGYVRVDTSNNIADGNVISATDLDNEFDGVQAGFNASTGHTHGGAAGEGAPITRLGPTQDVTISASLMAPKTTNTVDLGSSSLRYKDLFLAGNAAFVGTLGVTGATTLSAALTYGGVTLNNAVTGTGNMVLSASPTLTGTLSGVNASLSGTLAVTGVATLTAQPILSSLTASRAVFTDASKGLVSNTLTGTGNVVMSASPTLTGTISAEALTLSGAVTATGGTANGVAFLNGSKVLTTGSALTFDGTNFATTGTSSGGRIIATSTLADGSTPHLDTSATAFGIVGGSSSMGYKATSQHIWNLSGTSEQMRLTSTGLGIGTSSPATKLHVFSTTARPITAGNSSSTWTFGPTGESFAFRENSSGSDFLTLSVSGNLGLGVTPSAWGAIYRVLDVPSGSFFGRNDGGIETGIYANAYRDSAGTRRYKATGVAMRYEQSADGHAFFTAPSGTAGNAISFTQAMTLDASGNLLVGTTANSLGMRFVSSATNNRMRLDHGSSTANFSEVSFGLGNVNNAAAIRSYRANENFVGNEGDLRFYTSNGDFGGSEAPERARIDSSGNLLVGTTSTTAGSRFVVNQADAGNTRAAFVSHAGAFEGLNVICTNASYADICIRSSTSRAANTGFNFFAGSANGVNQFLVRGDGNVQNTNNSYGGISDAKLKENVTDATPKLEKLQQVRVVNYNLIGQEQKQIGVIAQELEQIFPGMIDESPDRDKEGNDLGTTTKSVKYSVFVPMLIKAMQEQTEIIAALTARITALESN